MNNLKPVFRTGKEMKALRERQIEEAEGGSPTPQKQKPAPKKGMSQADFSGYACGGKVKKYAAGGSVRGCGVAQKGKTKGRNV